MLHRLETHGFHEYGALPWFWHWIQAFTCSWEVARDEEAKLTLTRILEWLWTYRAERYLRGAWIGPQSRVLPHDVPSDVNALFDYVQFGDLAIPGRMPRLEGAGLFTYEVSDEVARLASAAGPVEHETRIPLTPGKIGEPLHEYVYRTGDYAIGGVLEYLEEYQNEQHRWDITFPARADGTANQAFFFHPGEANHASGHCEVLIHREAVAALYPVPEGQDGGIVGFLPLGAWSAGDKLWVGDFGAVYLAVHMRRKPVAVIGQIAIELRCPGRHNGVVCEVIDKQLAAAAGIGPGDDALDRLAARLSENPPRFAESDDGCSVSFRTFSGTELHLEAAADGTVRRRITA